MERAVVTTRWIAPSSVEVVDGQLRPTFAVEPPRTVTSSPMMLDGFLNLVGKPPQRIARYAQKWGMLGIHEEGGRWKLTPGSFFVDPSRHYDGIRALPEPLDVWQFWTAMFNSVFSVGSSIYRGKPPDAVNWKVVTSFHGIELDLDLLDDMFIGQIPQENTFADEGQTAPRRLNVEQARAQFYTVLFSWARFAQLVVFPCPIRKTVAVSTPSLFCALMLQLFQAITNSDKVSCSLCHRWFSQVRHARTDRRVFCPKHSDKKTAWRLAQRDHRAEVAKKNATDEVS